jgi:hypothetical protein
MRIGVGWYIQLHIYIYIHTYIHAHARTHTHTHAHIYISNLEGQVPDDPSGGGLEYLRRSPARRNRRQKGNPLPGCYNWATLFLRGGGGMNTDTWPSWFGESEMRE